MSSESDSSSQIISLPQGGGAQHGIGEKFSPDLHTGTGNFTVPLAIPAGRNGFQPQLNLVYSTGHGNGPFGLGWNLSVPGVSRKTSKGVPVYDDSKDVFILSGAEDLVPVSGAPPGAARYRPRTEGLFARILHRRDTTSDYWEVKSKDGLISLYGTPRPSNALPDWQDPASIAGPDMPSDMPKHIFAWKLTRTNDPFGNRIEYSYEHDAKHTDGPHQWDQAYLREIRYVNYGDTDNPQFLVTIRFMYGDRPDPFSEYRAGFEIRTIRRCTRIETYTHAGAEILARSYDLIYLDQRGLPPEQLPLNGISVLSQFAVKGHDGNKSESLPPLEFSYTQFNPEKRGFAPLTGTDLPSTSLSNPDHEMLDLMGNGLPDILETSGTVRYWRNRGNGRFDLPREMQTAPAGLRLSDKGVQLIDADGDGRMDLLVTTETLNGYYPSRFGGFWDRRSFQQYRMAPSFDLKDPEVRLVDLDGDGVTDAIRSGSRLECYFNDPKQGWNGTRWVERQALDVFPNVNFSDPRVKWADMTGDGLQDIALVHDGLVEYWPSLGRGKWAKRVLMRNSPRLPYGYDPKRILLGDVDGDGLADLVYIEDTRLTLWINQSGNQWSEPITIHGTPPVSDMDAVRLADILGNGVSCVLWSSDADGLSRANMFFLDFTGQIKPYLLNEMDNHMGAVTRVAYAPSTRFYLEDEKRVQTRWKTPLPFPVQVVARVEVIDQISGGKLTTEYSYHHGYWDGAEREFRGFGRTDQRDTDVFEDFHSAGLHPKNRPFNAVPAQYFSPPTETRTWFHQGPIGDEFGDWQETDYSTEFWPDDPQTLSRPASMTNFLNSLPRRVKRDALRTLRGQILRTELYALDGTELQARPYTVTEHLSGVREADPPGGSDKDRLHIFFPHALAERTTQWERGTEPMIQFKFSDDYDEYGQARSQISIAVPRGRNFRLDARSGEPYLATYTATNYAQRDDDHLYIVDRVARTTTYEILNDGSPALFDLRDTIMSGQAAQRIIGQTLNFYDGPAFQGLSHSKIGDHGALVRTENLVFTQEILQSAYKEGNAFQLPPYLVVDGPPNWTPEYPLEFQALLPNNQTADPTRPGLVITPVGYGFADGAGNSPYVRGYFVATERRRYDFHEQAGGRGLVKAKRDPLGRDVTIAYDPYDLLPIKVVDPVGLNTQAQYDYRVLQPQQITDPNQNRTAYAFTPLGLLESTAVMGKSDEAIGDTLDSPSLRLVYDFMVFVNQQGPIFVRTIRRVHHFNDIDVPLPERDETVESLEYSDGFGRLLQTRKQGEDVTFGDVNFGDAGLPADQSLPIGDAVGQERVVADPPRVVVSGWQIYDNKGRIVEKYEPFFSMGWDYSAPTDAQIGQKAMIYYDPRGHVIRTVNPDGSEQRAIYGVPDDITNPDQFTPTSWETYTYDTNDNAGRTHHDQSVDYQQHWNTPASAVVDPLGRTAIAIERNGPDSKNDWYITKSTYDIRGNLLDVTDPLSRLAFRHIYDLANRPLRVENFDAGIRRTLLDAAGKVIEQRDSNGALTLHAYDLLNRPIRLWARDDGSNSVTLRERLEYGDGSDPNQPGKERDTSRATNLLGKLHSHYDEAGLLTLRAYDFKGNVLEKTRQVISDTEMLSVFRQAAANNWQVEAYRVDWQPPDGTTLQDYASALLDATLYQTSTSYDALNRIAAMLYPQDVEGARKKLRPLYNRAGALEHVELDDATYVEHIAYNAKGQRTLITYGNGVMTRHAYEPKTFRLVRMRTEGYTTPAALTYHPVGSPLQDLAYGYDLVGNILGITDRTPGSGVLNNLDAAQVSDPELAQLVVAGDALIRHFEYDPLYRLLSATGRECKEIPTPRPWSDDPRCGFNSGKQGTPNQDNAPNLTSTYREQYQYDAAGNMLMLKHSNNGSAWIRNFGMGGLTPQQWSQEWPKHLAVANAGEWVNPPGNRLTNVGDGNADVAQTHFFDANGNLARENTERHFEWDHSDRMKVYRTQPNGAEPSIHAHYLYDSTGQRVKKLVRKQGGQYAMSVYIDGIFERYQSVQGSTIQENNTAHVMDNQQRVALLRVGNPLSGDTSPALKYQLGDHLGSNNLVIDDFGAWVNREEYFPYGETSLGSFRKKRYRFMSVERDKESGLISLGARYYAPSLMRWTSCDPQAAVDGINLYRYSHNSPLTFADKLGNESVPINAVDEAVPKADGMVQHPGMQVQGNAKEKAAWDDMLREGMARSALLRELVDNLDRGCAGGPVDINLGSNQLENHPKFGITPVLFDSGTGMDVDLSDLGKLPTVPHEGATFTRQESIGHLLMERYYLAAHPEAGLSRAHQEGIVFQNMLRTEYEPQRLPLVQTEEAIIGPLLGGNGISFGARFIFKSGVKPEIINDLGSLHFVDSMFPELRVDRSRDVREGTTTIPAKLGRFGQDSPGATDVRLHPYIERRTVGE